jgi:hypothetical protein
MVWASACHAVQSKKKTIAHPRTASPAALATRPIGTPPTAAGAERHGLGAVLLISKGRRCGCGTMARGWHRCGTMARGWHRCGTAPPGDADAERRGLVALDAERWHTPDQDPDHEHGLLRMRNRMGGQSGQRHKCKRTIGPTDKPSLSFGPE